MKHLLILFTMLSLGIGCYAQQYKVYSVVGKVTSNSKPILKGMSVDGNCPITIQDKSKVIMLDEASKEMITIATASSGLLKDLISVKNRKKVTDSYFQYILKKMAEKDNSHDKNVMQSSASAFRDGDSILMNLCCPVEDPDVANESEIK